MIRFIFLKFREIRDFIPFKTNFFKIVVYTSEYADYASRQIPTGEIAITGILQYGKVNGKEYYMIKMRDEKDCSSIK